MNKYINIHTNYTDYELTTRFLVLDVKGNGHCLFRSIGQALHYRIHHVKLNQSDERKFAMNLRRLSISEVCSNGGTLPLDMDASSSYKGEIMKEMKTINEKEFKKYCECQYDILTPGCKPERLFTWGGFHEIHALSNILNTPIVVYIRKDVNHYHKIMFCKKFKVEPLCILYVNNVHYQALLPKYENGEKPKHIPNTATFLGRGGGTYTLGFAKRGKVYKKYLRKR